MSLLVAGAGKDPTSQAICTAHCFALLGSDLAAQAAVTISSTLPSTPRSLPAHSTPVCNASPGRPRMHVLGRLVATCSCPMPDCMFTNTCGSQLCAATATWWRCTTLTGRDKRHRHRHPPQGVKLQAPMAHWAKCRPAGALYSPKHARRAGCRTGCQQGISGLRQLPAANRRSGKPAAAGSRSGAAELS